MSYPLMDSNMSSSLPGPNVPLAPGGLLNSGTSSYLVESVVGQGTFGKVVKCTRMDNMKTVAIKMMKNEGLMVAQAREEVSALLKLKLLDSDKCNLVQWYQVFNDVGHTCLEFEHLDRSLHDFMKERYYRPLPLKDIRPIVQQLANALNHLKSAGIIHADLKLENVMLVNHKQEPYRVKVIDFGLACHVSATRLCSYVQTRPYRSPEIILGLPFTEAIDMWSLGCMAASLYLGNLLFPGSNEFDMMRYIVETLGHPPEHLLTHGMKTDQFFQRDNDSTTSLWKLKTPEKFHRDTGIGSMDTRKVKLSSLDDLLQSRVIQRENAADQVADMTDLLMFLDMLKGMLQLDAAKRLTPSQVLEHQFTSMCHMISMYDMSSHVRSCYEMMDSANVACGSSQQHSSSTAHHNQRNRIPPTAVIQPRSINGNPCPRTQTTSSVQSGMKRNVDHGDGNLKNTHYFSERSKSRFHRESHAETNTSSRSQDCANANQPHFDTHPSQSRWTKEFMREARRRNGINEDGNIDESSHISKSIKLNRPTKPFEDNASTRPSERSPTEGSMKQGSKRRADIQDEQPRGTNSERSHGDTKRFRECHTVSSTSTRSSSQTQGDASPRIDREHRSHERSDRERDRLGRCYTGRSTCSSRRYSTHSPHSPPERRRAHAEHHSTHRSNTTQTERDRSERKRKMAYDGNESDRKRTSDVRSDADRQRHVLSLEEYRRRRAE